jgi:hypothetical protein
MFLPSPGLIGSSPTFHSVGGSFSSAIMLRLGVRPHIVQSAAAATYAVPRPASPAVRRTLLRMMLVMTFPVSRMWGANRVSAEAWFSQAGQRGEQDVRPYFPVLVASFGLNVMLS